MEVHGAVKRSLGPDCESKHRDAMVEKTVAWHSGFIPWCEQGEKSPNCESRYGAYHWGHCCLAQGLHLAVQSGNEDCQYEEGLVPFIGSHLSLGPTLNLGKGPPWSKDKLSLGTVV